MGKILKYELLKSEKMRLDEIMVNFDFKRVHRCMVGMEWEWFSSGGVPSIENLQECAERLLIDVIIGYLRNKISGCISTGGFAVRYHKKENLLLLKFIVSDYDDNFCTDSEEYEKMLNIEKRVKCIKKLLDE